MKKIFMVVFMYSIVYTGVAQKTDLDSLKKVLSKTTNLMEKYILISQISKGYYSNGTGQVTVNNNLELIRIALQLKNDSLIAKSYNQIGDFYLYEKGDNNTGVDYLFKGIPYAEKANNKRWLSSLYGDISDGYWYLKNFAEQLIYLQKAEANLPKASSPEYDYILLQLKSNYALYYLSVNQPQKALPYLNASVEINSKLNYTLWDVYNKTELGTLYMQSADNDLAGIYFKKALSVDSSVTVPYVKCFFRNFYLNYLINKNDYPEAKKQAYEMLQISEQTQNNFFKVTAIGFLKTVFDKQHILDSAYYYSKEESALKDTVFNQEKIDKIQALNFTEEVRSKQAREERQQNIQYALIALGIIIFITVFLLLSRTVIVNERLISFFAILGLLVVFEFINLLIHPWLASFTHDSPVLMLLSLVIVASLLIPMHHRLEKWIKEKMIEKNKAIRLTAAKKTIEKLDNKNS